MPSQPPPPSNMPAQGVIRPPPHLQQQPQQRQQQQQQPHRQGRGGPQGRGPPNQGRGAPGRGPPMHQQGRGQGGPVGIAPTTGIPYGHVPGYLPGSSSLVEDLDKRLLMVLRDGRHLVGILRSFDQFNNMVLQETSERKMHSHSDGITYYADIPLGVYVVRGESVVLMGQISPDEGMTLVSLQKLEELSGEKTPTKLMWDFDKDLLA